MIICAISIYISILLLLHFLFYYFTYILVIISVHLFMHFILNCLSVFCNFSLHLLNLFCPRWSCLVLCSLCYQVPLVCQLAAVLFTICYVVRLLLLFVTPVFHFCVIHLLLFILRSLFCCVFAPWFLFYTMYVFFNLFSLVCPCLNCAVRGGFLVLLCWVCVVYCCFSLKLLVLLRSVVICEHVKDWVGGHGLRVVEVVVFD